MKCVQVAFWECQECNSDTYKYTQTVELNLTTRLKMAVRQILSDRKLYRRMVPKSVRQRIGLAQVRKAPDFAVRGLSHFSRLRVEVQSRCAGAELRGGLAPAVDSADAGPDSIGAGDCCRAGRLLTCAPRMHPRLAVARSNFTPECLEKEHKTESFR
jgi:hypothetical protein